MKHNKSVGCWIVVGALFATKGFTEDFDFEIGLDFDSTSFDGSELITSPGGTIFNSSNIDTDELSLFGSWYFAGLSDDNGPRARAVFVDRASSIDFGYFRSDQTNSVFRSIDDPTSPVSPINSVVDSNGDSFAVGIHYVDRDSGWFGDADVLTSNTGLSGIVDDSRDTTGWNLGVGKYLYDTTALSLSVGEVDSDFGLDGTVVAIDFTHLGTLGNSWQYATDLKYSRLDANVGVELDTWDATFALYPTNEFEFGVSVSDVSQNRIGFTDLDSTAIKGFASWYVTPNVKFSVRYGVDDVDYFSGVLIGGAPTASDADQDSLGISATVRF